MYVCFSIIDELFLLVQKLMNSTFQFQGAPLEFMDILSDLNLIFTTMFTVECVLKLSSFGPKVNQRSFTGKLVRWEIFRMGYSDNSGILSFIVIRCLGLDRISGRYQAGYQNKIDMKLLSRLFVFLQISSVGDISGIRL